MTTIVTTTNTYIRSLGKLTPQGEALASIARSCATKLLAAETDDATSSAASVPRLAYQLRSVLTDLGNGLDPLDNGDPLLDYLINGGPPPPGAASTVNPWGPVIGGGHRRVNGRTIQHDDPVDPETGERLR